MADDRIVAVGFLSQADLTLLGSGFTRQFPVIHDDIFADLLGQLDKIDVSPHGNGVVLRVKREDE